jgi:hypothetical protein
VWQYSALFWSSALLLDIGSRASGSRKKTGCVKEVGLGSTRLDSFKMLAKQMTADNCTISHRASVRKCFPTLFGSFHTHIGSHFRIRISPSLPSKLSILPERRCHYRREKRSSHPRGTASFELKSPGESRDFMRST